MATSPEGTKPAVKVFVATTVMLTFISFWRASAIVLSDLASSAYYAGGDAEKVIGKSAPWFILAVMLFSYAVRALYIESSSMFVRGGVYRVVKEAMGGTLAKFSVSALLFDYVLTGPISAVSAGQYLAGFIKDIGVYLHRPLNFSDDHFAAGLAVIIVIYFWWKNTQGIHESSQKALQIMVITTVMVVLLIIWCTITVLRAPIVLPPNPLHSGVVPLNRESLGWLNGTWFSHITWIILFVGFGHSVLAMSGEETLAQVNREIEHPKLKNLEKTGLVIFVYSLLFTSLVSFFAVMIIPDSVRPNYFANLIGGIAVYLVGPTSLKLLFHGFVVLVGVLILAGAQNTSIVGANGVLNRVAEDGVLTSWFQKPHNRYGTSYRIINLIVCMQMLTIFLSLGNVYVLAALYAFGVIWSFAMKSLAVLVLRFTEPENCTSETLKSPWDCCSSPQCCSSLPSSICLRSTKPPSRGSSLARSSSRYLPSPSATSPKSATASLNSLINSASTAIRNWEVARWECAPAISWWRCAILAICTTCEMCSAIPTPASRT
jgi:amino acid transporter